MCLCVHVLVYVYACFVIIHGWVCKDACHACACVGGVEQSDDYTKTMQVDSQAASITQGESQYGIVLNPYWSDQISIYNVHATSYCYGRKKCGL